MFVCVECGLRFETREEALKHTQNPRSKSGPGLLKKRHQIFPATGRGWHTGSSLEPAGQQLHPSGSVGRPLPLLHEEVA